MDLFVKTQISAELRDRSRRLLDEFDAVVGPTVDGGWYALGLRDPAHVALVDTAADTGTLTLTLLRHDLRVAMLPMFRLEPTRHGAGTHPRRPVLTP